MFLTKKRRTVQRLNKYGDKSGFSLLEIVLVASLVLVLSAGGILSYGGITEQAKVAKTQSAASDVYKAAIISLFDNDPTTTPDSVTKQYNESNDKIRVSARLTNEAPIIPAMITADYELSSNHKVSNYNESPIDDAELSSDLNTSGNGPQNAFLEIDRVVHKTSVSSFSEISSNDNEEITASDSFCVTATMIEDSKIISSAGFCKPDVENPGEENPGDGEIEPPEETIPPVEPPTETTPPVEEEKPYVWDNEAIMTTTWNTSIDSACSNITLPFSGVKPGTTIDWGDGKGQVAYASATSPKYNEPGIKTITIFGKFDQWYAPSWDDAKCLTQVTRWGNTGTINLIYGFKAANNLTLVKAIPETATAIDYLFDGITGNPDISGVRTPNVKTMAGVFRNASNFDQALKFETSKVTTMYNMFQGAKTFNKPINFDTSQVTNMGGIFQNATSFNQSLNFNTANVTNVDLMLAGAASFNQPLTFNMPDVTSLNSMFSGATSFNKPIDLTAPKVTSMQGMFENAISFNQSVKLDTSKTDNMQKMFFGATNFNQKLDFNNTSNVTNMSMMFQDAKEFNQDLNFNTSKVTAMANMFFGATKFNQIPNFSTTMNVTDMNNMFRDAISFNQDLSGWNVSKISVNKRISFNYNTPNWTLPKPKWN